MCDGVHSVFSPHFVSRVKSKVRGSGLIRLLAGERVDIRFSLFLWGNFLF